jgi:shikimate kinase
MVTSNLPLTQRNMILTGYMEPNKPRIGRQVADQLHMPFIDVSERIEQHVGESTESLRRNYGERHLKTVESTIMEEVALHRSAVIRIDGSTLMHGDHHERLLATGPIICLVARLDAILQRMHLTLGARYHNPDERAVELGHLKREWAVRNLDGIHELDVTYHTEAETIRDTIALWRDLAIERA